MRFAPKDFAAFWHGGSKTPGDGHRYCIKRSEITSYSHYGNGTVNVWMKGGGLHFIKADILEFENWLEGDNQPHLPEPQCSPWTDE